MDSRRSESNPPQSQCALGLTLVLLPWVVLGFLISH